MQFTRSGNRFTVSRVTGPTHNVLSIEFADAANSPSDATIAAIHDTAHLPRLRDADVLHNVLLGIDDANVHLATRLVPKHIEFIPTDSPPATTYRLLAHAIAERVARQRPFDTSTYDSQLHAICGDVLLSLQSDIVSLAELRQIIRDADLPGGPNDAAVVAVLRRVLEMGIAIGTAHAVGGTYVKFIAWQGTVDARCDRAMAEAARHDSDFNRDFSFWLCLPRNVDEFEASEPPP